MYVFTRHPAGIVITRCNPQCLYFLDDAALNHIDCLKRSIDLFGKDQGGVLELAFTFTQCTIAKIVSHYRSTKHDRRNKRHAAEDKVADRTIVSGRQTGNGAKTNSA